jgi:hypothetical protein
LIDPWRTRTIQRGPAPTFGLHQNLIMFQIQQSKFQQRPVISTKPRLRMRSQSQKSVTGYSCSVYVGPPSADLSSPGPALFMTSRREMAAWRARSETRVTCEHCLCQSRFSRSPRPSRLSRQIGDCSRSVHEYCGLGALRLHSRLGLVTIVNLGSGLTPSARFTAKRVVSYALPKRFRIHSMVDRRSGS